MTSFTNFEMGNLYHVARKFGRGKFGKGKFAEFTLFEHLVKKFDELIDWLKVF